MSTRLQFLQVADSAMVFVFHSILFGTFLLPQHLSLAKTFLANWWVGFYHTSTVLRVHATSSKDWTWPHLSMPSQDKVLSEKRPRAKVRVFRVSVHTILVRLVPVRSVVVLAPAIPRLICPQAFLTECMDLTSLEQQRGPANLILASVGFSLMGWASQALHSMSHCEPILVVVVCAVLFAKATGLFRLALSFLYWSSCLKICIELVREFFLSWKFFFYPT